MKRYSMPDMKERSVNVTPLIDIVMCLIIFFMLVAHIGISTGADATISIPETVLGTRIDDLGNTLTLNIKAGVGDQPVVTALVKDHVREIKLAATAGDSPPTLVQLLTELRKHNSEFKVILRGDKDMPYKVLEPVLAACSQANVGSVSFNTRVVSQ